MLASEMETLLRDFHEAVSESCRRFRLDDGCCRGCGARRGRQHQETCALWPAILWKQKHSDALNKESTGGQRP